MSEPDERSADAGSGSGRFSQELEEVTLETIYNAVLDILRIVENQKSESETSEAPAYDSEELFDIEEIVSKKVIDGKTLYSVKWKVGTLHKITYFFGYSNFVRIGIRVFRGSRLC